MHLCENLLEGGYEVLGIDNMNDYYDIFLKKARLKKLNNYDNFNFSLTDISNNNEVENAFKTFRPLKVVNLAAQAGVRHSIENPFIYIESNITGFMNILEACRHHDVNSLIYASSSSVYGGNEKIPFSIEDRVDKPISIYAASKRANELMAYSYSHLYGLNTIGLRFFTVYGPWGRPDMSPIIFTKAIILEKEMQLNNFGKIIRDFTYIDDVVESIYRCCQKPAIADKNFNSFNPNPSTSESPYRVFNVGNNNDIEITYFISLLEKNLNKKAKIKYMPLPPGDVIATDSDNKALQEWINYQPQTLIEDGIKKFLKWYKEYYKVQ